MTEYLPYCGWVDKCLYNIVEEERGTSGSMNMTVDIVSPSTGLTIDGVKSDLASLTVDEETGDQTNISKYVNGPEKTENSCNVKKSGFRECKTKAKSVDGKTSDLTAEWSRDDIELVRCQEIQRKGAQKQN